MNDVVSATQTPFPLQRITSALPSEDAEWMRIVRQHISRPSVIEAENPARITAYCFDLLLEILSPNAYVDVMDLFQKFSSVERTRPFQRLMMEVMKEYLDPVLCYAWCLETSWGSDVAFWKPETPSVGQQTVTALFFQECFGGQILSKDMAGGVLSIWNRLPEGVELDMTRDQPVSVRSDVLGPTQLMRSVFLRQPEIQQRFDLFRSRMIRGLIAYGMAAASLAYQRGWQIPVDRWDVG